MDMHPDIPQPTPPIRLYMSMSLDGFIAGPDDRMGQELGRDGGRLFNWLDDRMSDGPSGQVFGEAMATGAVISGRRTFELAGRWQGDHHDGVPIFVLTHRIDDDDVPPGSAQFVTDVEDCVTRARAAVPVRPRGTVMSLGPTSGIPPVPARRNPAGHEGRPRRHRGCRLPPVEAGASRCCRWSARCRAESTPRRRP